MDMTAREARIEVEKDVFNEKITQIIEKLNAIPLAEGIDKNSWLYAGCVEDLDKARTRIMNYIERVLR